VKWLLRIHIEATERPVPTGDSMNLNVVVQFRMGTLRTGEGNDLDFMASIGEFVSKHLYMKITTTDKWRWVTIGSLKNTHQTGPITFGSIVMP
jgi:hypothetical protein